MKIFVSACLMGENCKYNGGNNYSEKVAEFVKGHEVIALCPEVMGGLPTPRVPAEIVNGVVTNREGVSVDHEFRLGAQKVLDEVIKQGADLAILQSRSPSCGAKEIYDGTFSRRKIPGMGVFAQLLAEQGITVLDLEDVPEKVQFVQLQANDPDAVKEMSRLATSIVKEHFDPLIGSAQNDYMIQMFQTVEAISGQLAKGYQYYFVVLNGEKIGFEAFYPRGGELYLSKFYLKKEYRGRGYSKQMLAFAAEAAAELELGAIVLNVNRDNSAVQAYKKLGFTVIREEKNDIGQGYVMDDFVMEYVFA